MDISKQLQRLQNTSDSIGLVQHSKKEKPNLDFGYSIDDVARGLIILARTPEYDDKGLSTIYMDYITNAQREDGLFHNFFERQKDKSWTFRKETPVHLYDCFGRVIWTLAEVGESSLPQKMKDKAEELYKKSIESIPNLTFPMSKAFTLLGTTMHFKNQKDKKSYDVTKEYAQHLADLYEKHSDESWQWFSDEITYCNGRLPHAMLSAGKILNDGKISNIGKKTLDFLLEHSFDKQETFHAIGNDGWFKKGEVQPARYDQQTIEASAVVEACIEAYKQTGNSEYVTKAQNAFTWYTGNNIARKSMICEESSGIYDAITKNGINTNQGAESIIAYLMAATKIRDK